VVPGTAVKLTATCTPAATTFNWSNTGFTNKVATGSVKPASTTTYSVSGSNANGTGSVANVVVSVVKPAPPSCSLTASSTNVVAGNSVTLTAKCIPVASSYVWTNTSFASQAATGAVKPTTSTTYSVSGVNAGGTGEVAKATVTVTNPKPLAPSQLTSPSGVVTTATPAFSWNAAAGATSYTLKLVSPSNSMVLKMSAASWGCGNGTGVCAVKPAQALQGNVTYTWSVIASNAAGDSPESAKKNFKVALSKDGKLYPAGNYEAGPISTNTQAQQVCPPVCSAKGLKWGGNWSTTVAGKMSVCGCSL
jgi:hypothetical protein